MKPFILKRSISRKCLHKLSIKQRKKIMSEIKSNLQCNKEPLQNNERQQFNINNIPCTSSSLDKEFNSASLENIYDTFATNVEDNSLSNNDINDTDSSSSTISTYLVGLSFKERLASCFLKNDLNHVQCNSILSLLRTHPCFENFPKDERTLLKTPRNKIAIFKVEPGEYVHFEIESSISQFLSCLTTLPDKLEIDFNTDGVYLDKSGSIHIWPIQCRISNIKFAKSIIVGIYRGTVKPYDPNLFFEKFVTDITKILANGGITFNNIKLPLHLRCFIADAPARAFILNHRSHVSSRPCSKCKVSGVRCERRYAYYGCNHVLRNDRKYLQCIDEDHHKGQSPLSMLPIGMVSQIPLEYMHLVCLGIMKKLLSAWVHGKYRRLSKLSARSISIISRRLNILTAYCPSDFVRRPRSLDACMKYKATEFRQFLLYVGPVVTYGILDQQVYTHFLFLHAAIRILASTSPSEAYLNFANLALQKFVDRCINLYGLEFYSYNVHGLLHLTDDVRRLGPLDSFSAFPYENNMIIFRKYCRKSGLFLQQIANRMAEIEARVMNDSIKIIENSSVHVFIQHYTGPLPCNFTNSCQYRKITFNNILLSLDIRDNCCMLNDGTICIILNILMSNNSYYLIIKKFLNVCDFYDIGISSSMCHIFKCSTLNDNLSSVHISEVRVKCYKMPFWDRNNDDENAKPSESSQYIIATIIHNDRI